MGSTGRKRQLSLSCHMPRQGLCLCLRTVRGCHVAIGQELSDLTRRATARPSSPSFNPPVLTWQECKRDWSWLSLPTRSALLHTFQTPYKRRSPSRLQRMCCDRRHRRKRRTLRSESRRSLLDMASMPQTRLSACRILQDTLGRSLRRTCIPPGIDRHQQKCSEQGK